MRLQQPGPDTGTASTLCERFTGTLQDVCSTQLLHTVLYNHRKSVLFCLMSSHHFLHDEPTDTSLLTDLCHFPADLQTCNHTLCLLPRRLNILPTAVTGLASTAPTTSRKQSTGYTNTQLIKLQPQRLCGEKRSESATETVTSLRLRCFVLFFFPRVIELPW